MSGTHTLVLGAGFGGLTAATELASRLPDGHRVTLVDRRDRFLVGAMKLQMLDGRRGRGDGERAIRDVERAHPRVRFLQAEVEAIDVDGRSARVGGEEMAWDHLVVALGAELDASPVPGLREAARNLYAADGVADLHEDLARLESGARVLFLVTRLPFKCPPAPYEAAMIASGFLQSRGVDANVAIASPEPQPLPVAGPECGGTVRAWAEERGVDVLSNRIVREIDPAAGVAKFEDGSTEAFDVLAAVPPHRAPRVLADAGLLNEAGWLPVDRETLATRHENVWAVGDCTVVKLANGKPLVKAGVMAEGEARVVAANIAARVRGDAEDARFDGKGACFLELGGGEAVEVQGDFYATPNPIVAATAPSPKYLEAKRLFESERLDAWFGAP